MTLDELLDNPKVKAFMDRPYRVKWEPMPLTGGSNKKGDIYYLDPSLKNKIYIDKQSGGRYLSLFQNVASFILLHERVEKALRECLGMSYDTAHRYATEAEKNAVKDKGIDWESYKKAISKVVKMNEKKQVKDLPKDFDRIPLDEYYAQTG